MKILNKASIFLILSMVAGCGITPSVEREKTVIYQPVDTENTELVKQLKLRKILGPAPFYGMLATKPGDTQQSMMYHSDAGAGGFFAQIIVHAAIANDAQNTRLANAQKASNRVLSDYQTYIEKNTHEHLQASIKSGVNVSGITLHFLDESSVKTNDLIIETNPVFYLSQDEKTIVVEHHAKAFYNSSTEQPVFENVVKVISAAKNVDEKPNAWLKNDGEKFLSTTSDLYRESLYLLINDMYGTLQRSDKKSTYRYYVGDKKYYVRASLIQDNCDTTIVRNLKGNIVVFPKLDSNALCES